MLSEVPIPLKAYEDFFAQHSSFHVDGFDFPVGKPDAKGYYNAQFFGKNRHLGEDWNAVTGGNSDLGQPIYSIGHAYVYSAKEEGPGWGKVVRLIHYHPRLKPAYVESLYAHCDSLWVEEGDSVKRGDQIATIGNADGRYLAHLHLEMRDSLEMPIGGGYGRQTAGYLIPTNFINSYRNLP
ncbi:MAG: M23 family metallopeptidase [Bacteroidota bacterium]